MSQVKMLSAEIFKIQLSTVSNFVLLKFTMFRVFLLHFCYF